MTNDTTELSPSPLPDNLLSDEQVAELLSVSVAFLRKQRHLRRKGLPHTFKLDPVLIGDLPRYRLSELTEWMNSL